MLRILLFSVILLSIALLTCNRDKTLMSPLLSSSDQVQLLWNFAASNRADLEKDAFRIGAVKLSGDTLKITVGFGGGCRAHEFFLFCNASAIYESNPPQVDLYLSHNANGDMCDAYLTETRSFELTSLKSLGFPVLGLRIHDYQTLEPYVIVWWGKD